MFWRMPTYSTGSVLQSVLDRGSFTLEDLLDKDDVIQETKAQNGRLIAFLKRGETLGRLLGYLTESPPEDASPARRFKHPFNACEVLCCESDTVLGALAGDGALLSQLFAITSAPRPLDCMVAGYFARVVGALLMCRPAELLAWLQAHPAVLSGLVEHLDTVAMAETLVRLVGADEQTASFLAAPHLAWLSHTELLPLLLARLHDAAAPDAAENAAEVLAAVARARASPLTAQLGRPPVLRGLLQRALAAPRGAPLVQALNICIALLERRRLLEGAGSCGSGGAPGGGSPKCGRMAAADAALEAEAVGGLAPYAPRLQALLCCEDATATQETPYGLLRPPLGSARLTVVALVAALLRTGRPEAEAAIVAARVLPRCLGLVLRFPFNSILHHQMASIVGAALDGGSDALLEHLLGECGLAAWLTTAPDHVTPLPRPGDPRAGQRAALRAGYVGHLTAMANKLVAAAERRPLIAAALAAHGPWQAYADQQLAPRNEREDLEAWECGRPVRCGALEPESPDDALFGAALHLQHLAHLGGAGNDAAARSGGASPRYGSAFDDEDEEGEEDAAAHRESSLFFADSFLGTSGGGGGWGNADAEPGDDPMQWRAGEAGGEGGRDVAMGPSALGHNAEEGGEESDLGGALAWRPGPASQVDAMLERAGNGGGGEGSDDSTDFWSAGAGSPPSTWEERAAGLETGGAEWPDIDTDDAPPPGQRAGYAIDEDVMVITAPCSGEDAEGNCVDGAKDIAAGTAPDFAGGPRMLSSPGPSGQSEAAGDGTAGDGESSAAIAGAPERGRSGEDSVEAEEETLVGSFTKLRMAPRSELPAPGLGDECGASTSAFNSFTYWRTSYQVEVDADAA